MSIRSRTNSYRLRPIARSASLNRPPVYSMFPRHWKLRPGTRSTTVHLQCSNNVSFTEPAKNDNRQYRASPSRHGACSDRFWSAFGPRDTTKQCELARDSDR